MANEKRLIDANAFFEKLEKMAELMKQGKIGEIDLNLLIASMPTVDAVEVVHFNALQSLVNGEWVDSKLVQDALGIDFNTAFGMFDFIRTAEWNPDPLNGQKITTKFRLKNAVVHGRWEKASQTMPIYKCSVCKERNLFKNGNNVLSNYCPNCGAKMDGGNEDG